MKTFKIEPFHIHWSDDYGQFCAVLNFPEPNSMVITKKAEGYFISVNNLGKDFGMLNGEHYYPKKIDVESWSPIPVGDYSELKSFVHNYNTLYQMRKKPGPFYLNEIRREEELAILLADVFFLDIAFTETENF